MRHYLLVILMMCTTCASIPDLPHGSPCDVAWAYTVAQRLMHPCEFADALAACVGVRDEDRQRIANRCADEIRRVR